MNIFWPKSWSFSNLHRVFSVPEAIQILNHGAVTSGLYKIHNEETTRSDLARVSQIKRSHLDKILYPLSRWETEWKAAGEDVKVQFPATVFHNMCTESSAFSVPVKEACGSVLSDAALASWAAALGSHVHHHSSVWSIISAAGWTLQTKHLCLIDAGCCCWSRALNYI